MNKVYFTLILSVSGISFTCCSNGESKKVEEFQAKLDSIAKSDSM